MFCHPHFHTSLLRSSQETQLIDPNHLIESHSDWRTSLSMRRPYDERVQRSINFSVLEIGNGEDAITDLSHARASAPLQYVPIGPHCSHTPTGFLLRFGQRLLPHTLPFPVTRHLSSAQTLATLFLASRSNPFPLTSPSSFYLPLR